MFLQYMNDEYTQFLITSAVLLSFLYFFRFINIETDAVFFLLIVLPLCLEKFVICVLWYVFCCCLSATAFNFFPLKTQMFQSVKNLPVHKIQVAWISFDVIDNPFDQVCLHYLLKSYQVGHLCTLSVHLSPPSLLCAYIRSIQVWVLSWEFFYFFILCVCVNFGN